MVLSTCQPDRKRSKYTLTYFLCDLNKICTFTPNFQEYNKFNELWCLFLDIHLSVHLGFTDYKLQNIYGQIQNKSNRQLEQRITFTLQLQHGDLTEEAAFEKSLCRENAQILF